jgi:hypothetical protein
MTNRKSLLTQTERVEALVKKARSFEDFLRGPKAHDVEIILHENIPYSQHGTIYQMPNREIRVGGQPISHHNFELHELIKELREELETVNKMSSIKVDEARRQLLMDLQEKSCPANQISTEAKSL